MAQVIDSNGTKKSTTTKTTSSTSSSSQYGVVRNTPQNVVITVGDTNTIKPRAPITTGERTTGGGGRNSVQGASFNYDSGVYETRTTGGGGKNKVNGAYLNSEGTWTNYDTSSSNISTVGTSPATAPVEKVKRDLSTFSASLKKSAKYNKLASNLTTLYEKTMKEGAEKQRRAQEDAGLIRGIFGVVTAISTAINPIFGAVVGAGGELIAGQVGQGANDTAYVTHANEIAQIASNVLGYSESLQKRDELLVQAMDSITSEMNNMRNTYGGAFVDQFYNLMLAKSGMTPDDYSLLTGNFRTFEAQRYGTESGEAGLWDELTESNADMFNNFYAQLTQDDLKGIQDSLNRALFSGETEVGYQLRGYENDLNTMYQNFVTSQWGTLADASASLEKINRQNLADQINNELAVGSAEAERASSGVRGGTAMSNERLARFNADLSRMAGMATATNFIRQLRYEMEQQKLTASSQAYNYRSAQRQLALRTQNAMLSSMTSVGMTAGQAESKTNAQIINAGEYKKNAMEGLDKLDADETEIVLDSL